ncbi:MAG: hypothetical protein II008_20410 [Oscillospiraceae bacterium]|nr:hypothetical protein [Oscillospiraceae bacterium]
MAFLQTDVNYAAEYSQALAQAYPYLSYFGAIWAGDNSTRYRPGMGKTMYIPTIQVSGAVDVNRNQINGTFNRNWNNEWQSVELQMDREWNTLIDPLDITETNDVATIANVTRAFTEMQKVPEMDAFLASKLAGFAADFGGVSTQSLTSSSILTEWDNALEYMTNQRVNRDRLIAYMTPGTYKLLKQATGLTRFIEVTNGIQAVDRNVARLDGVTVVEVPVDMMKTAYTFTEGWAIDTAHAVQINFLLVDPMAVAAPIKYETAMMSAPTAQSKGKYLYYERYYYGAFILNQRQAGVYAHLGSAPSVGTLTVTSTAGTAAGSTKIAVSGYGIGQNGDPDEGLVMKYCPNNATDSISFTYNTAPASGTWTEVAAAPFALTSQTANYYIYVVLINKQTGGVVAAGKTQNVVGV